MSVKPTFGCESHSQIVTWRGDRGGWSEENLVGDFDLFGEVSFDYRASKHMILRQVSFGISPLAFSLLNLYSTGRVTPKIKGLKLPDKGDVLNETLEN